MTLILATHFTIECDENKSIVFPCSDIEGTIVSCIFDDPEQIWINSLTSGNNMVFYKSKDTDVESITRLPAFMLNQCPLDIPIRVGIMPVININAGKIRKGSIFLTVHPEKEKISNISDYDLGISLRPKKI